MVICGILHRLLGLHNTLSVIFGSYDIFSILFKNSLKIANVSFDTSALEGGTFWKTDNINQKIYINIKRDAPYPLL